VELGVTTGANTKADPLRADISQQAITEQILGLADRAGYAAALIDGVEGTVMTWLQFARTVRMSARGLGGRGLQRGDTVGILVRDAASHALAVHAARAAGAAAVPIYQAASAEDIAIQLKECRARLLITSAALAETAIQAAERSVVRQVFAFGEAAGTTPFVTLLNGAKHAHPERGALTGPNGSIGATLGYIPAQIPDFSRPQGADGLTRRDVVVAGPPCGDTNAYTAQLDKALATGATIVAAPLAHITAAVRAYKGTAAIVPCGTAVPGLPAARVFTVG